MATGSNAEFYPDDLHMMNRHAISFQSGAVNSTSEIIPMGGYFPAGMLPPGNFSMVGSRPGIIQAGSGSSSGSTLMFDSSVLGLKHDAGFAVEWSAEEEHRLDEGLAKFKDEPSIMKYIKIASMLRDKTVRDVALRCRWIQRKRRKPEEHPTGKKTCSWKAESSSHFNILSALPQSMAAHSPMINHMNQNKCMVSEGISTPAMRLLEQNAQAFDQISSNLSAYKVQDNLDLFHCTRNNITTVLNYMREMPGIMSQMPPLPVSINEDLANSILPGTTNVVPRTAQLKHEPSR